MDKLDAILRAHVADGDSTDKLLGAAFAVVDKHGARTSIMSPRRDRHERSKSAMF